MNATVIMNDAVVGQALISVHGQRVRAMCLRLDGVADCLGFTRTYRENRFDFVTPDAVHGGLRYESGSLWVTKDVVWGVYCEFKKVA